MHGYHDYPDNVVKKDSARGFAETSSDQTQCYTLKRYDSEMTDAEMDLLMDVEDFSALNEWEWEDLDHLCALDMSSRYKFDWLFE